MITAEGIGRRLAGLEPVGARPDGVFRLAWTAEDTAAREWFAAQARELGLRTERDPAGNLWACPATPPPWWGVGSHLDSVRGGGQFDGPLGVACGFELAAAVSHPIAVLSFADEEGARFNTPTFGSKALAGKLELVPALGRRDDEGIPLARAIGAAGVDPHGLGGASSWLEKLAGFIEIHIDQTTELARAESPVGIVSSLASRRRLELELRGRPDHAGTTPRSERRDALSAAAHLTVAAEELAERFDSMTVTVTRIVAEPNAPTTIAAHVRLWLDARSPEVATIDEWQRLLTERAEELSARTGVESSIFQASRSDGVQFSSELRSSLHAVAAEVTGVEAPDLVCFAGHDAGVLADRIPAAMVFVRNETGISHSPQEHVELADAALATEVVRRTLEGIDR